MNYGIKVGWKYDLSRIVYVGKLFIFNSFYLLRMFGDGAEQKQYSTGKQSYAKKLHNFVFHNIGLLSMLEFISASALNFSYEDIASSSLFQRSVFQISTPISIPATTTELLQASSHLAR